MNKITVVALEDLPPGIMEELEPFLADGDIDTMELSRRFCLDCGVRWRSERVRHPVLLNVPDQVGVTDETG